MVCTCLKTTKISCTVTSDYRVVIIPLTTGLDNYPGHVEERQYPWRYTVHGGGNSTGPNLALVGADVLADDDGVKGKRRAATK